MIPGPDIPRNFIVEPDGTLLFSRALDSGWYHPEYWRKPGGSPNLQLCRSRDRGKTWQCSEGKVAWDYTSFGEVASIRLRSGKYLATLRRQVPDTRGEGYEDTVITESTDGGKEWSKPRQLSNNAEVHFYLTQLKDGRVLGTYSNYHLPWGTYAVVSNDQGKTWDLDHPIQLSLSADLYVGWPVTLQLPDGSLLTSYAVTSYYKQQPEHVTCELVHWRMPGKLW
jgi:hypothetical protein